MTDAPLANVLIVDDDSDISELLRVNLRSEGYSVSVEADAASVMQRDLSTVDLIVVDAMLQQYNGMALLHDLKADAATEDIAVIICTKLKSVRRTIEALEAGADDYVVKPFSLREVIARIRAVTRRIERKKRSSCFEFLSLFADLRARNVTIGRVPLRLTATEFAILALLLKNVDNLVPRIEIFKKVWSRSDAGSNLRIVDTNISRLRKKLGALAPHLISRTGHGYMLSTELEKKIDR